MGPFRNLGFGASFYRAMVAAADATTEIDGTAYDMLTNFGGPFDCMCYILLMNVVPSNATMVLKVQGSLDGTTWTGTGGDLLGSHQGPPTAATDNNRLMIVDGYRWQFRYLRPVITRATAGGAIDGCIGIAYNAHSLPVTTQHATVAIPVTGGSGMNGAGAAAPVNVVRYAGLGTA